MIEYVYLSVVCLGVLVLGIQLPNKVEERVWQVPQQDGNLRWMTMNEAIREASFYELQLLNSTNTRKLNKIKFFLYTPDNPKEPFEIVKDNTESLVQSTFNSKNPTRFMIHGWNGVYNSPEVQLIRDALLLQGDRRQFNFIAVDWSVYAHSNLYITSQKSVSKAGKIVAEFIDWMHDNAKLSFDTLALYGHSLGAHVVGFTGKNVRRGRVHTIVGLDPAMPLFTYDNLEGRLAETDAKYVESIHTNGGVLGFYHPIGKASFYPNGGQSQPGCGQNIGCAHGRSVEYLAEALALSGKNGFIASKCKAFDNIKNASCSGGTLNIIGVRLGQPGNALVARGIYYLETNNQPPYGLKSKTKLK